MSSENMPPESTMVGSVGSTENHELVDCNELLSIEKLMRPKFRKSSDIVVEDATLSKEMVEYCTGLDENTTPGTRRMAGEELVTPAALVYTARKEPASLTDNELSVKVGIVAPSNGLNVAKLSRLMIHCTVGEGKPNAIVERVTLEPKEAEMVLGGCVVMDGAS